MSTFSDEPAKFWHPWCSNQTKYLVGVDKKVGYRNSRSGFVQSLNADRSDWGCLLQSVDAHDHKGKRISFSAQVKTSEVVGEAGIFAMVVAADQSILLHDAMSDRFLAGSVDWSSCTVVLDVPENARYIKFGAILVGNGRVWIDDLEFQQVDSKTATTDKRFSINKLTAENQSYVELPQTVLKPDLSKQNLLPQTGWYTASKGACTYSFGTEAYASGELSSFYIKSNSLDTPTMEPEIQSQGWLAGNVVAIDCRKKRLRFSAVIKTENVIGWCGLMMSLKGAMNSAIAHTDMCRREISGTRDWEEWSVVLDVPTTAYYATITATLHGKGTVWFSQLLLEEVTPEIPTTDKDSKAVNLDFATEY